MAAIDRVFRASFCETFAHLYRARNLEAFLASSQPRPGGPRSPTRACHFRLAEVDGETVGFVKLGPLTLPVETAASAVELRQIYILKGFHGAGIGRVLMDWAIEEARRRGARKSTSPSTPTTTARGASMRAMASKRSGPTIHGRRAGRRGRHHEELAVSGIEVIRAAALPASRTASSGGAAEFGRRARGPQCRLRQRRRPAGDRRESPPGDRRGAARRRPCDSAPGSFGHRRLCPAAVAARPAAARRRDGHRPAGAAAWYPHRRLRAGVAGRCGGRRGRRGSCRMARSAGGRHRCDHRGDGRARGEARSDCRGGRPVHRPALLRSGRGLSHALRRNRLATSRFFTEGPWGKPHFDLAGYVATGSKRPGSPRSNSLNLDTYAEAERFYSYRRATHRGEADYGRQASLIGLPRTST